MKKYVLLVVLCLLHIIAEAQRGSFTVIPIFMNGQPSVEEKMLSLTGCGSTGALFIMYKLPGDVKAQIQLLNSSGEVLESISLHPMLSKQKLDFSNKPAGIYKYLYLIEGIHKGGGTIEWKID